METILQRYNTHKRFTLDRLTAMYANQASLLFRDFYESLTDLVYESLEEGESKLDISEKDIPDIRAILEKHFKKVVKAGVSDGYLEVSPDKKLGLWLNYPIFQPVEDTFTVKLARKRDTLADYIEKTIGSKQKIAWVDIIDSSKEQSLEFLRKTYANLANDWLEGKSSVVDVKEKLQRTLAKQDAQINTIFRTQTTDYFNRSRLEYFKSETSVTDIQIFGITDGRQSQICEDRHGLVVPIEMATFKRYLPPFHPNCRTVQRGLIRGIPSHDRLIKRGEAMDESRFTPLPRGWA